jgi:hypothetical protein
MKRWLFGTMLLALLSAFPIMTMAAVDIRVGISLPPPIVFAAPPAVIVMPETNDVYVVPDIDAEMFFWNGWWWRPWEGRWYRSHYYSRGWAYYSAVPSFYFDVDPGWRGYYRSHNWYGHPWNYERIPNQRLQQNWQSWHSDRHWERQGTWGVQSYQPRPQHQRQELRQQRQQQYQQRPEVQQLQQQRQPQVQKAQGQQQRQPQALPPQQPPQEKAQQHQRQEQEAQGQQHRQQPQEKGQQHQRQEQGAQGQQSQHSQSQGKAEGGEGEHKK